MVAPQLQGVDVAFVRPWALNTVFELHPSEEPDALIGQVRIRGGLGVYPNLPSGSFVP